MNGLMSAPQEFIVNVLRQFNALRIDQIEWLLKIKYDIVNARSLMRQLAYMGKARRENEVWCGVWRQPVPALMAAFDVMMALCPDTIPEFYVGHTQCQLVFYIPGEEGEMPNSFKVYYVVNGQEIDVCEYACAQRDPPGHTVLYIVSSNLQIARLYCDKTFFAALKGGDGNIEFFQGGVQN